MSDIKLIAEVEQVMQSVVARTQRYLESEFAITVTEPESGGGGDLNALTLLDMTAIIGMGGNINLLIAFGFEKQLIDVLYQRMTEGFNVQPDEVEMYREAAAGEVINTILGHCTGDLQKPNNPAISMTPPVILDGAKTIRRMGNAMFYTRTLDTALGHINVSLVGPRKLFDTSLNYTK